jgi:Aldehyde dehydrogenase family
VSPRLHKTSSNSATLVLQQLSAAATTNTSTLYGSSPLLVLTTAVTTSTQSPLLLLLLVLLHADADKESTVNSIVGAAFGAAGQRCMALSVAVFIGDAQHWIPDIVAKAAALKVNVGSAVPIDIACALVANAL